MRNGTEPEAWTPEQTGACDGDLGSLVRNGEWGTIRLPAQRGKKGRDAALPQLPAKPAGQGASRRGGREIF